MADWTLLPRARRDRLGEGITYAPRDGALYWVDILGQRLNRYGLADQTYREWAMPDLIGWVIPRRSGPGFIAGLRDGFYALELEPELVLTALPSPPLPPEHRLNDACADRQGRIWAGSMGMTAAAAAGALFRLDPDPAGGHRWTEVDGPYRIANGPAIAPDGAWLYHADSAHGLVFRLAVRDDGSLGPREVHIAFPPEWGSPDGMTVDAEGGLWIAHWGGGCVSRFAPDGGRERTIPLPASQITRPCFAGPALDRMFVTSAADGVDEPLAGAVFEVAPGVPGLAPQGFGG